MGDIAFPGRMCYTIKWYAANIAEFTHACIPAAERGAARMLHMN